MEINNWILSYPRSGNTWVRLLVANMQNPNIHCGHKEVDYMIPDIQQVIHVDDSLIVKTHDSAIYIRPGCRNVLYIYRDVRDVIISCYHYRYWVEKYKADGYDIESMSFDEFFDIFVSGEAMFGHWDHHVAFWYFKANRYVENVMLIKFEDLLLSTTDIAYKIAEFFNIKVDEHIVNTALLKTNYGVCKRNAPAAGVHPKKLGLTGKAGGWKDILSKEHVAVLDEQYGDLLKELGYEVSE